MPLSYSLDLERLAAAYASRELTPVAVVRDVLSEIERAADANPAWIHVVARKQVLTRARDLEQRCVGGEALPLYGVPFAVKDNIDLAGAPTTAACPAYSYVAGETAHAVQRLEAAGAICIGKTNMDQFATGLVGTRSPYGACTNPFDERYISGGSSSGSAVAVALGHVSFALGTDTAGSGRVPAGFCNIVGLKPTRGLVSMRGVVPACRSLDCVSVFALTCEDAWTVSAALAAYDPRDPFSREQTPRPARTPITPVRCGVLRESDLRFFGDETARQAYARTLESLKALDAELVEIDYAPYAETARLLYEGPWVAERLAAIEPFYRSHAGEMDPAVRTIIAAGDRYGACETFEAQYRLQALKRECAQGWHGMDMLVVPTAGTIYRLEEVADEPIALNANLGYYTNFVNLLDLAAIAVPAHFRDDGLPFGVTLIAPALEDATLERWGARLHRAVARRLGATQFGFPAASATPPSAPREGVTLAVVGAHLSGMPLNHQLTRRGAVLIEACFTAPAYRLYALPDSDPPKPGLARVRDGSGAAIAVELWRVPAESFGSFVEEVPAPLAVGTVALADGRDVKGFVCESHALESARDITRYGGWRSYAEKELFSASEIL